MTEAESADCLAAYTNHRLLANASAADFIAAWRSGHPEDQVTPQFAMLETLLGTALEPGDILETIFTYLAHYSDGTAADWVSYTRSLLPEEPPPATEPVDKWVGKLVRFYEAKTYLVGEVLAEEDGVLTVRTDTGQEKQVKADRCKPHKGKAVKEKPQPPAPEVVAETVTLTLPARAYDAIAKAFADPAKLVALRTKAGVPPAGETVPGCLFRTAYRPDRVFELAMVSGGEGQPTLAHIAAKDEQDHILATLAPSAEPFAERTLVIHNEEHYRLLVARGA